MDEITLSLPTWPLSPGGPPPRWDPDHIIECTVRDHLADLNQRLLIAKAHLDVESFRSILSEIERIRYGLDPRYNKAPPVFVPSAVTSAFSEDGRSNIENLDGNPPSKDKKKWFRFSKASKLLRRLLFFRRRSPRRHVGQGVPDDSRNDRV